MAFHGSVDDQLAIRRRIEAYSTASHERDGAAWIDCFTDDGVRIDDRGEQHGKDELRAFWRHALEGMESIAFMTEIGPITGDDKTAAVRVYVYETVVMKGSARKFLGFYDDTLVKQDRVWRFSYRRHRSLLEDLSDSNSAAA